MEIPSPGTTLHALMNRFLREPRLHWIGPRSGRDAPATSRRNRLLSGVALAVCRGPRFGIGDALRTGAGSCDRRSGMADARGPGGSTAMPRLGGIFERGTPCPGAAVARVEA